jgi:hypothetical protein
MRKPITISLLLYGVLTVPFSDEPKTVSIQAIETIQKSVVAVACVRPNAKGEIEYTKTISN